MVEKSDETRGGATNAGAGFASGSEDAEGAAARFAKAKDKAKEFVGQKYDAASGAVRDGYSSARERIDDADFGAMADQARTYVRSNPGKALLVSIGVGFLVGLLLRRDED